MVNSAAPGDHHSWAERSNNTLNSNAASISAASDSYSSLTGVPSDDTADPG